MQIERNIFFLLRQTKESKLFQRFIFNLPPNDGHAINTATIFGSLLQLFYTSLTVDMTTIASKLNLLGRYLAFFTNNKLWQHSNPRPSVYFLLDQCFFISEFQSQLLKFHLCKYENIFLSPCERSKWAKRNLRSE